MWFIYLLKAKRPLTSIVHVLVWERSILVCVVYDDLIYKLNLMLIWIKKNRLYLKKPTEHQGKNMHILLEYGQFCQFVHCRVKVKIPLIWLFNSFCICQYLVNQYNGSFTRGWGFKIFLQTNLITKMEKKDSLTPQLGCWWC